MEGFWTSSHMLNGIVSRGTMFAAGYKATHEIIMPVEEVA